MADNIVFDSEKSHSNLGVENLDSSYSESDFTVSSLSTDSTEASSVDLEEPPAHQPQGNPVRNLIQRIAAEVLSQSRAWAYDAVRFSRRRH